MKILKMEVISKKPAKTRKDGSYYRGKITVGTFTERFYMYLNFWDLNDYKQQWREGLERIKTHDSYCLIADLIVIDHIINLQIYYLHKINNKILVMYQMYRPGIFKDLLNEPLPFNPFNTEERYKNLPPLRYKDEDGNNLETWEADLDGIVIE